MMQYDVKSAHTNTSAALVTTRCRVKQIHSIATALLEQLFFMIMHPQHPVTFCGSLILAQT